MRAGQSRYPSDLGHNFVLAHASCNARKSDYLASEEHLEAWQDRKTTHAEELHDRFTSTALPHDSQTSVGIARWAYSQTEQAGGQVWVEGQVLKHLEPGWQRFLAVG